VAVEDRVDGTDGRQLRRQSIRLTVGPPTAICERRDAAILVAFEDLVAGFPRDPERSAEGRHLLALEQSRHKAELFVHDVTLFHESEQWPRQATRIHSKNVRLRCVQNVLASVVADTCVRFVRDMGGGAV